MKTRTVAAVGAAMMCGLLMSAAAPYAAAGTDTQRDARGDAPAHLDLLRARYRNSATVVAMRVRVRNVSGRPAMVALDFYGRRSQADYQVWALQTRSGHRMILWHSGTKVVCRGMRAVWRPRRNIVRLRVPHGCAPRTRQTLELTAYSGTPRTEMIGDPTDWMNSGSRRVGYR